MSGPYSIVRVSERTNRTSRSGALSPGGLFGSRRARSAFTLLEILVVIAIVALLMGLLVPAFSTARRTALMMQSQSNMRQMFMMAEAYANRSAGRYPVGVRYERDGTVFETIAWDWRQTSAGDVSPGPLWQFGIDPGEVMQDPACEGCSSTFGSDPFTGYNYNTTFIAGEAIFPNTGWSAVRPGLRRSQWLKVETTALFGLGGWKGGANKFMRAPENRVEGNLQTVYAGGQAFRYDGRTLICYLDGHTGTSGTPHEGVHATEALLRDVMGFPKNGFLSNDDDLYDPRK